MRFVFSVGMRSGLHKLQVICGVTFDSMTNLRLAGLLAVFLVVASFGEGQQVHDSVLQPLSFLSGRWVNKTPTEVQEEIWTADHILSVTGSRPVSRLLGGNSHEISRL